jgi:hypothetical protein
MLVATDKDSIPESIISSYEARIQSIGTFFEATGQIVQDFQDTLLNTRAEREQISGQLRESLARNASLRKKDFDRMMGIISSYIDQSEQEIRQLSRKYLDEQTKLMWRLREGLQEFRDALADNREEKVKKLQTLINDILCQQDESKNKVTSKLKQFQRGHQQTSKMLTKLLAKGEKLRMRDFKRTLAEFERQRRQRAAYREQRRRQVRDMLGRFKAERTEAERSRLEGHREDGGPGQSTDHKSDHG